MSFALSLRNRKLIDGVTAWAGVDDGPGTGDSLDARLGRIDLLRYAQPSRRIRTTACQSPTLRLRPRHLVNLPRQPGTLRLDDGSRKRDIPVPHETGGRVGIREHVLGREEDS
jgi:hypothetical protein